MNVFTGEPRFCSGQELRNHLRDLIVGSSKIDIASAWVSESAISQLLNSDGTKAIVRIVVGVGGYSTDPVILKALDSRPNIELKIHGTATSTPLFHPKLYSFRHAHFVRTLIGSMNMTKAGATQNIESMLSIACKQEQIDQEFERFWNSPDVVPFASFDLLDYEVKRRTVLAAVKAASATDVLDADVVVSAESRVEVNALKEDWSTFLNGLKNSKNGIEDYRTVLEVRQELIGRDWSRDLTKTELAIMFGLPPYYAFGHLPALNQNQNKFQGPDNLIKRQQIGNALKAAMKLTHFNAPIVEGIVRQLLEVPFCKAALTTRLLVLARPDLFVVVNLKSFEGLQELYGLKGTNLDFSASNYVKLLQQIQSTGWYRSPEPEDASESEVWQARASLVDALVYREKFGGSDD
jgi:HKD family nuclease